MLADLDVFSMNKWDVGRTSDAQALLPLKLMLVAPARCRRAACAFELALATTGKTSKVYHYLLLACMGLVGQLAILI